MVIKQQFQGGIGRTWTESEPHFEQAVHAAGGAPNVIIVLLDDTGFAQLGCFGSAMLVTRPLPSMMRMIFI